MATKKSTSRGKSKKGAKKKLTVKKQPVKPGGPSSLESRKRRTKEIDRFRGEV